MAGGGNINMGGCAIIGVLILAAIGSCLPKKGEKSAQSSVRYVAARSLNCRASDSIGAAVVRSFRRDDSVTVAEERGDWARLEGANSCWVASRFLASAPGSSGASEAGDVTEGALTAGSSAGLMSRTGAGSGSGGGSSSSRQGTGYASSGARSYASGHASVSKKKTAKRAKASAWKKKRGSKRGKKRSSGGYSSGNCPCSGYNVCIGPRGGRYCITSGGNKRYGV